MKACAVIFVALVCACLAADPIQGSSWTSSEANDLPVRSTSEEFSAPSTEFFDGLPKCADWDLRMRVKEYLDQIDSFPNECHANEGSAPFLGCNNVLCIQRYCELVAQAEGLVESAKHRCADEMSSADFEELENSIKVLTKAFDAVYDTCHYKCWGVKNASSIPENAASTVVTAAAAVAAAGAAFLLA
eukprot:CAMPEP_0177655504 /NCGR_PEP_ID=MMETSP0447-20121125/15010_1 /TAXON_ID=0 /ORGANISM="Stygamoeba regulata, Strain BSH-02190019" /LENGTH=187 /DNA_ID=CAMNT_0019159443 /DNA_START=22 /DNA_END=585 /DNA_ORIENTATION=-